jgi:hypothetical protein
MRSTALLVAIIIIIITSNIGTITYTTSPIQLAYAHNFVPALAASFLTRINQIKVETQLVENNIPWNLSLANQHAQIASELFDNALQNDLYYNAEENNGLAKKLSDDIPSILKNLQNAVRTIATGSVTASAANMSKQQSQQQITSPSTAIKHAREIVNNINNVLDKAVYVRVGKLDMNNSTVHALVLADITEKAYNDYSYAFGIKPIIFSGSSSGPSSMKMMNMGNGKMGMGGMGNMMLGSGPTASSNNNSSVKNPLPITKDNDNSSTVVNITAYQQAQGLAMRAQQIFNNELKSTSSVADSLSSSGNTSQDSTNNTVTNSISKIENNLTQLKSAIDSKAPTMDVMKIVHGDIHPALLMSYKLQLRS